MTYHVRTTCRLCGSDRIEKVLSLPPTPPANEFVQYTESGIPQDLFPLYLVCCRDCAHVQLPVVVDPERLFRNYKYVSGTAASFRQHLTGTADHLSQRYGLGTESIVLEIGSNDGTMLKAFQARGIEVLGVDPAVEIGQAANNDGVPTLTGFFDASLATRIYQAMGPVDLIVANNVFAHADELASMVFAIKALLKPTGVFVFEVSYLVDVLNSTLFDTIYHEHLSYHAVIPLIQFLGSMGLQVTDVERIDTHGGSIRVHAQHADAVVETSENVVDLVNVETAMGLVPDWTTVPESISAMEARIEQLSRSLMSRLTELKLRGDRIAVFGAPAKATTLMYRFGLDARLVDYIVDDSPLKQGLYSPGLHVPVVPSSYLYEASTRPDCLVVLAWNFADAIIRTHSSCGARFIVPLPTLVEHDPL